MERFFACILIFVCGYFHSPVISQKKTDNQWLHPTVFNSHDFVDPAIEYAPFTRWWWPGNDVTKEELKREIQVFKDNHFGGVEIQSFALVMPTKGEGRADRIMGYDTPAYYDHVAYVIQQAQSVGLTVDLTNGSGWPPGGSHIQKEDGNLTLQYGIIDIPSNQSAKINIPRPIRGDDPAAQLVALLVAKTEHGSTESGESLILDPKSVVDISSKVTGDAFTYSVATNNWKAIAIWSVPTMEQPMIIAKRNPGYVYNHFDSVKVIKNYDYLFGERTGLQRHYGKTLRAIFNDSYEFKADRHFSNDFLSEFEKNRGYALIPYLPVNLWFGYNNMYARMEKPGMKPDFKFSDQDWRLRYDYDLTLSDLLGKHFLNCSKNWTESRGMLHRTQAYGLNMDIIAAAGATSIPEVETMLFAKGSENGYKLITSGAHLHNRPIVSSETGVYFKRAYMTTPQKIKLTFDKLFSSGVNQVIYHGTPYRYFPEGYPKEGWYPFYNSALGIDFSSDINENNPFWKYISDINQYAQRAQYVLRSGKPHADVLIYYPFLNYSEEVANKKEVMVAGYLKDTEPPLPFENKNIAYNREVDTKWLQDIMPLIDELNKKGITWDWINDASIQEMNLNSDKKLDVRGNIYQSIVLFDLPYIQKQSAEKLKNLAKIGANILLIGEIPSMQPSYLDYHKNDILTQKLMEKVAKAKSTQHIADIKAIAKWSDNLSIPVSYVVNNGDLRQQRRKLDDNSYAQFIWNESSHWSKVTIKSNAKLQYAYWMDAKDGSIQQAELKDGGYQFNLGPFSTIFFLNSSLPQDIQGFVKSSNFNPENAKEYTSLSVWDIKAGEVSITNTPLFDWKTDARLKYNGKPAVYTASFDAGTLEAGQEYVLDLGKVYDAADIKINGKNLPSQFFEPFVSDISTYLQSGENTIEITITNAAYNDFVGQAENGEKVFKKLKGSATMSAGLVGPVKIWEY